MNALCLRFIFSEGTSKCFVHRTSPWNDANISFLWHREEELSKRVCFGPIENCHTEVGISWHESWRHSIFEDTTKNQCQWSGHSKWWLYLSLVLEMNQLCSHQYWMRLVVIFCKRKTKSVPNVELGVGVTYFNLKAISSLCWAYGVIIPKEFFAGSTCFVMAFNSSMTKVASSVFRKFGVRSFGSGELCVKSKLRIPYALIGKVVSMHSGEHFNRLL